ncbi:MAG TPA: aldo/keto reductase [Beijerinckiaceae bacterium]|nr:aldo/keto reductase [Beijerinckiaceae bacterium]
MDQIIVTAHGAAIPAIGYGTWTLRGEVARDRVRHALACGYRHIDTAIMYENEIEVGEGMRQSGVPRDEIFLTTKVPPALIGEADLVDAAAGSIRRLGVDQVDLLLIHWPNPEIDFTGSIRALCKARTLGLARHIGVSNFTIAHLDQAWQVTSEPLVTNQCEYHPRLDQSRLIAACRRHGMSFTSYSPVARGALFGSPPLLSAARAHGKSESQVLLRWHIQQPGIIAVPRSATPARIAENLDVFDFSLTDAEMAAISALKAADGRIVRPAWSPQWDES